MCGDHFSRTPTVDSGDLVAIIHPSSQQPSIFPGGRLHLSNRLPGSTVSTAPDLSTANAPGLLSVRIHQFGQPLLPFSAESANPVLHSFAISPGAAGDDESCLVGRRLNLGVGGDGVVGRTVSLIDEQKQVLLGQGVIGWI
ncbi:hypothetical protein DV737_g4045, partial [Chaetothyriales sp. CBS 132003]